MPASLERECRASTTLSFIVEINRIVPIHMNGDVKIAKNCFVKRIPTNFFGDYVPYYNCYGT